MKFNKLEWVNVLWAVITLFVLGLLLLLDISRQREALQLESRVVYEFVYERALLNEVILHNFVALVETDYSNHAAIKRYASKLRRHYPHLRRLQIYQRVSVDQQGAHEQAMQAKGYSDYKIHRGSTEDQKSSQLLHDESSPNLFYPIVFADPQADSEPPILGEDGYAIRSNRQAFIRSSHYLTVFATTPSRFEDGAMGYQLLHALDPNYTDSTEAYLVVALVLSVDEYLPPLAHIPQGMSVTLLNEQGGDLVSRDNSQDAGGWLLPQLNEQRSITRFGQTLQLRVKKQLFWRDTNWPFGLIILMFSIVAYLISAQGLRRREEAQHNNLQLRVQLEEERDQLEQRVLARTQELVSRNSELRQQVKENRRLTQKILEVQESERRNIARELHDEMGQSLTAIRTDARLLQQYTSGDRSSLVYTAAVAIDTTAQRIYSVTYALMRALRPSALDDLGLVDALNQCVDSLHLERQGIELELQLGGALNELPEQLCIQCFRIVQEALTNCVKYASASQVCLLVRFDETEPYTLVIRVEDDGVGFDPSVQERGFGLIGMRERALALEGTFEVRSLQGQGTWIQVELPVKDFESEGFDID